MGLETRQPLRTYPSSNHANFVVTMSNSINTCRDPQVSDLRVWGMVDPMKTFHLSSLVALQNFVALRVSPSVVNT